MARPNDLTEGSISRGLLQFTLPILFANVLQSLNGFVNQIWVGHGLGEAALTATVNANTVMFLLIAAAFGVAMASSILVGQSIGARNLSEAKRVVGSSASFFTGVSVLMAVMGLVLTRPLLVALSTPAASQELAEQYMRVIFLGLPFLYLYPFVMGVLRGAGDAKTPLYFMLLSVGLDIALNPLLIFGIGPFPKLGIAGSAFATVIGQGISLVALIAYLYRSKNPLALHGADAALLRPDWDIVRGLIFKGIPMSAQMLVISGSGMLMLTLVNGYGETVGAAYSAAMTLWNYIMMPAMAVGMAVSSMAAQNVGARKWGRVNRIAGVGTLYCMLLTGPVVLALELLDTVAFRVFLPAGSPSLAVATHLNHVVTWSFLFFGVSMTLFGVVRATGAVWAPLWTLIIAMLLVRYPVAKFFLGTYHQDAIWWSFPISSALSSVLAILYYQYGGWRSAHMLSQVPPVGAAAAAPTSEAEVPGT
jgi:putative MATE family efflux protein